ncbi:MAG: rhomboid family intramembrane serine protease [Acidobacteria bacterium]|nr:rhomboid family intramembrane serine protease [Acidobacteriota bacterium]
MAAITKLKRGFEERASILFGFIALLWGLELVDFILPGTPLDSWGIRPRHVGSLPFIFTAPFLHGGFAHLVANTIPIVILGWLVMARSADDFWRVIGVTIVIAGLGTWALGAPGTIHIGASSIVFGFIGFLLLRGVFEKSALWIAISIVVAMLYGGALFSLFSVTRGISWTGHVFGFVGGIVAARRHARG